MATITLQNGTQVTVPDDVAQSYTSRGQARHDEPAPAEQAHDLDTMTIADLREHAETHGIEDASAE